MGQYEDFLAQHGSLAHHGIKGMRWGVRRSDAQLSSTSSSTDSSSASSGKPEATRLSADAERTLHTLQKAEAELSDREMKEAINRANQIKTYNQLFGADNKSPLQKQVENLQLQKQYKDLQAELNPPRASVAKKLVSTVGTGYGAYKKIDDTLDGQLSAALAKKIGIVQPQSKIEQLTEANKVLELRKTNVQGNAELNTLLASIGKVATGDSPSLATGYTQAGKRRAGAGQHFPFGSSRDVSP